MAVFKKGIQFGDFYKLNIDIIPLCERDKKSQESAITPKTEPDFAPQKVQSIIPKEAKKTTNLDHEVKTTIFAQPNPSFAIIKPKIQQIPALKQSIKIDINEPKYKPVEQKKYSPERDYSYPQASKPDFAGFIKNKLASLLKFSLVSATIFCLSFFAINLPAYSEIIKEQLKTLSNGGKTDLTSYEAVDEEIIPEKPLPITTVRDTSKLKNEIPPLVFQLSPPDNRIIIPKINKNVPIVETSATNLIKKDWETLEKDILADLKNGVVHFPGTAIPGEKGNAFITGHSSYYPWDNGKYKDVFALLPKMEIGDEFYIYYNQQKYHYKISEKNTVKPNQVEVLKQTDDFRVTLMTCVPVGTNLKRLVLTGQQV